MYTPGPYDVETFSGQFVDVSNPRIDSIKLEDIAHALSQICRYGGHCRTFYSVAEHSVAVSKRMERRGCAVWRQFAGLHHDDTEYVLGDVPRPTKPLFGPRYAELSLLMDQIICDYLNMGRPYDRLIPSDFHARDVKDADNWMLFVEARHLLPSKGINWSGSQLDDWGVRQDGLPGRIVTPDYWHGGLQPLAAEQLFLARHDELLRVLS